MKRRLPKDSKVYIELAFREKEKFHRRRISFTRKLEILDQLLKSANELPKLDKPFRPS